ncbi:MAG: hypothetical protein R2731_09790 [Nocardioides sp.]
MLVARHRGQVRAGSDPYDDSRHGALGGALDEPATEAALAALSTEARGRLRGLVAGVDATAVGVVSWTLLADGWHAVSPVPGEAADLIEVRRVEPADLATLLAPALAEAVS